MQEEIIVNDGRITVFIKDDDGSVILIQPFNPMTGSPFKDESEAEQWANDMIALMGSSEPTDTTENDDTTQNSTED